MAVAVRTYFDSCVLLAVVNKEDMWLESLSALDDPGRSFISSKLVELETLPSNIRTGRTDRAAMLREILDRVAEWVPVSDAMVNAAIDLKVQHDLNHLDAMHLALAAQAKAEFMTLERPKRPMFRVRGVKVVHVTDAAAT